MPSALACAYSSKCHSYSPDICVATDKIIHFTGVREPYVVYYSCTIQKNHLEYPKIYFEKWSKQNYYSLQDLQNELLYAKVLDILNFFENVLNKFLKKFFGPRTKIWLSMLLLSGKLVTFSETISFLAEIVRAGHLNLQFDF